MDTSQATGKEKDGKGQWGITEGNPDSSPLESFPFPGHVKQILFSRFGDLQILPGQLRGHRKAGVSPTLLLQAGVLPCHDSVSPAIRWDPRTKHLSSSWDIRNPPKTSLGRRMPPCQGWLNPPETQGITKSPGNHTSLFPYCFIIPKLSTANLSP